MPNLSERAIRILRECAGTLPPREWGAEDGAELEGLIVAGLLTETHAITDQGREIIE